MPDPSDAPVAAIILAAGKSTRMRSKLPKPLHPLCGLPMTSHVIRACRQAGVERIVVVVGHQADAVREGLGTDVTYALQQTQRGTGDAVRSARPFLQDWPGTILVLAGDVPLLRSETLAELIQHQQNHHAAVTLLTAILNDPTGYGRIVRNDSGGVARIVEQKDASEAEKALRECNPSIYAFQSAELWASLSNLNTNNAQGEFYLTDTIGVLNEQGKRVEAVPADDFRDVLGVNNRVELAFVADRLRQRLLTNLMLSGVTLTDPATTYIDVDVEVGQDTVIEPNTYLLRGTKIGEDCVIGPLSRIEASTIGNHVRVLASQVVESTVEDKVKIGPFANLRPGTYLETGVKIGDFVETKKAHIGAHTAVSHLSYIGDAEIGEGVNIGAGTITCNYDGFHKHKTIIGNHAFIGSHSTLIAPITIGDGAFIAAASAIPRDVPGNALAIARPLPTLKEDWAKHWREKHEEQKG